jgi:beta-galactosidase
MKKIFFIFNFLYFIFAAAAQDVPHHLDPRVVSIGKEPPRGDVVSHDTREDALRWAYHRSKYLQPLSEWTTSDRSDAVVYSTRYKIPFGWLDREMFLYLGKVSGSFDVVINGEPAGYSQTGSTPSEFDVTRVSKEGNNDLEIVIYKEPISHKLENSRQPLPPKMLGEVYVLSQPKMRVRDIFIDTRMEGTAGIMELGVIMKSHQLNAKEYRVYYELVSPRGEILSEGYRDAELDMQREDTVRFFANIPRIIPWSHEEPRLYTLFLKTQHEGRFKEFLAFRIGFRGLEFTGGLTYLNHTPLKITMREFTPTADIEQMRTQIEALRAAGVNTLKLQGGPPSHRFYELCDELGVYLCNGADIDTHLSGTSRKVGGNPSNQPEWEGAYLDRVMSMYHTSKNSPSVVMFSLASESANGYNLYESYLALKAIEKKRPVIYPEGAEWDDDPLDFVAMNTIDYPDAGEHWAIVTAEDVRGGRFRVRNTRYFTSAVGEADYKIVVGKKVVSQGAIPVEVMPQGEAYYTIPINNVKEGKEFTVQIEVTIPRRVTEYTPLPATSERKVFAGEFPLSDNEKTVIGQGVFPSENEKIKN